MNSNILLIGGVGFLAIALFLMFNPLKESVVNNDISNEDKITDQEIHFESKGMEFKEDMIFRGNPDNKECVELCFEVNNSCRMECV